MYTRNVSESRVDSPVVAGTGRAWLTGHQRTARGRERDSQRSKVYSAEVEFCNNELQSTHLLRRPLTAKQACRYAQKVLESEKVRNRWYVPAVRITDRSQVRCWVQWETRRKCKMAFSREYRIPLYTVIHECAHAVTPKPHAWHGPLFCSNLLELIRRAEPGGKHAEYLLLKQFIMKGVQVGPEGVEPWRELEIFDRGERPIHDFFKGRLTNYEHTNLYDAKL